jgi:hypothetical protein
VIPDGEARIRARIEIENATSCECNKWHEQDTAFPHVRPTITQVLSVESDPARQSAIDVRLANTWLTLGSCRI